MIAPILTDRDFQAISNLALTSAGLSFSKEKRPMIRSRLANRIRVLQLSSFSEYCDILRQKNAVRERQHMISALTTNVTRFFREPHHFDLLRQKVLPPLVASLRKGESVRIWSAGCSKGQEAYSIGMTLLDLAPDAASLDVKILATDIDPNVVRTGHNGCYQIPEMAEISSGQRLKYFKYHDPPSINEMTVRNRLRRIVRFRELNLINNWPMKKHFDVIFCRNVLIYFDAHARLCLLPRFEAANTADGWLFLGHAEKLPAGSQTTYESAGVTAYRRYSV
ncbi:protein-glutamate O-methyltransferase CheR [Pseudohalocynthiibacter aestuariivivens]|nr:protein-glutamate O-methyltransferase CheR [Pseudohalocynthiibacter aestuariivivens]